MECPVCAALNREHNQECEAEASATIKQRCELIAVGDRSDTIENHDQLDQEVLRSRKRQAHIAFELHEHRTAQHPIPAIAKSAAG